MSSSSAPSSASSVVDAQPHGAILLERHEPARDARLVACTTIDGMPAAASRRIASAAPGSSSTPSGSRDVVRVVDDRPVAIEQRGATPHARSVTRRAAHGARASSSAARVGSTARRSSEQSRRRAHAADDAPELAGAQRDVAHRSASPASAMRRARKLRASGNAPPPTLAVVVDDVARDAARRAARDAAASARARSSSAGAPSSASAGISRSARGRLAIERERRLERGERELVDAIRARERILAASRRCQRRVADDEPGLRSAEQLVAAHHDDATRRPRSASRAVGSPVSPNRRRAR